MAKPTREAIAANVTARMILEAGAVKYSAERPFFLSSGWASPVYIEVQRLISFPRICKTLMDLASQVVLARAGFEQFDAVAGAETTGIAYAAWMAERLSLPLQYVRRKPRGFGVEAQVEGALKSGARVLLVDDVTTDGRTKIQLCRALRSFQARVDHVFVLFFYDIFPEARTALAEEKIHLHYLASWRDILEQGRTSGYFAAAEATEVERFLEAPARWSLEHGGIGAFPR
jgi:orotate phosphoribosyltransferase